MEAVIVAKSRKRRKTPAVTNASALAARAQRPQTWTTDLAEEYHYVVADLQRIAVIAALLVAGLVILSFVLR